MTSVFVVIDTFKMNENEIPLLKSICDNFETAFEILIQVNFNKMTKIIELLENGKDATFSQTMTIIKVPINSFIDIYEHPQVQITDDFITETYKNKIFELNQKYEYLKEKMYNTNILKTHAHLHVDPKIYEIDRKRKENEHIKRLHVEPVIKNRIS